MSDSGVEPEEAVSRRPDWLLVILTTLAILVGIYLASLLWQFLV